MRARYVLLTARSRLPFVPVAAAAAVLAAVLGQSMLTQPVLANGETARREVVQTQRAISDDVMLDQSLMAMQAYGGQQTAALPGMRALRLPRFNAVWPTHGVITTYFGEVSPVSPRGHSGIDVAGPRGTAVEAMDGGEVLKAYWNTDGYGGLVVIAHPSGFETWYGHLARLDVEPGQTVARGEAIGQMGSTGYSTGPHLHFEVRQEGNPVDPLEFLSEGALQESDS